MVRLDKSYRIPSAECPTCGNHIWTADLLDGSPVWQCTNCSHRRPRKVTKRGEGVTPAQRAAADRFMFRALHWACPDTAPGHACRYEVKKHEEKMQHGRLSVVFEVGLKNDDGTAASIFCRDHYMWFFGRKGGVSAYDSKLERSVNGDAAFRAGRF